MQGKQVALDSWQEEIIKSKGHLCLCTGRQVGKTLTFARKAAERMIKQPNSKIIIVSLTEDQAKLIIVMILDYLQAFYDKSIAKGKNKPTQNKIVLKNGSSAIARPVGNTGDAVRGFTGDVLIIDEASRMPALMWAASRPTLLTTAGEIWMCSTPAGKEGYFWEAFQNKNNRFKVFHINSEEVMRNRVISDTWTEKQRAESIEFLKNEREDMSELQYGQEYLGLFLEELQRFFSEELIRQTCILKRRSEIRVSQIYSLGVDIARMGRDDSVFAILDKLNKERMEQVENIITKRTLTTATEDRIRALNQLYNFEKIYIDAGAGSLGVGIFDSLLRHDDTKRKIVAINNRAQAMDKEGKKLQRLLKEDLYDNLRSLMEKNYIKLLDDAEVILSLASVQYEIMKDENKMRIFGNYTHCVEALIRAAWIAKEKDINIWIKSIKI